MASIRKEILIDAAAAHVWDALRDFDHVHTRVAPGFVVALKTEPGVRIVTFANGSVARELFVDCDDARRRLVYAIQSERLIAHSASVQVFDEGKDKCRVVWITDVLPHDMGEYIDSQMSIAVPIMQKTLGG
jgi:hypothetical protein